MKHWQKIFVGVAFSLALRADAVTNDLASGRNSYAVIAAHNIFNLRPVTQTQTGETISVTPPPRITINGITSIFGPWEVLFKVSLPARAGHPAGEKTYLLDVGQSQDDMEIRHIDLAAGVVTFNNHGVLQDISMADAPPVVAPGITANPAPPVTVMDPARVAFERSRMPDYLGGGSEPVANGGSYQNKTLEQRVLMIEAQRAYYKSQNDPRADELPPTAMTPADEPATTN